MFSPQLWGLTSTVRLCHWFGRLVTMGGKYVKVSSHMPSQGQGRGLGKGPQFPLGRTANLTSISCQASLPKVPPTPNTRGSLGKVRN